jgi:hypothetical protein
MTQFHHIHQEILSNIEQGFHLTFPTDQIWEFKGYPSVELGISSDSEIMGLYLTFSPQENEDEDELSNFLTMAPQFFNPLREILENLFSEETNNDACSYSFSINTNHADLSNEDNYWEITIEITDYLS